MSNVKNPEFEAKINRGRDGKFADKNNPTAPSMSSTAVDPYADTDDMKYGAEFDCTYDVNGHLTNSMAPEVYWDADSQKAVTDYSGWEIDSTHTRNSNVFEAYENADADMLKRWARQNGWKEFAVVEPSDLDDPDGENDPIGWCLVGRPYDEGDGKPLTGGDYGSVEEQRELADWLGKDKQHVREINFDAPDGSTIKGWAMDDGRMQRNDPPEGWHVYSVCEDEDDEESDDGEYRTYARIMPQGARVNHRMDFATRATINTDDWSCVDEDDWGYGERNLTDNIR